MRHLRVVLVGVVSALAGCGGSGIYRAGGKVVFKDGTPLAGGVVLCEPAVGEPTPEEGEMKSTVRGYIQPDGTFVLGTLRDDDGAREGKYRVKIQPPERMAQDHRKK